MDISASSSPATVRVRFAPSPTGMMHLGNVRAALLNYLFARQKGGEFLLRIEDTDTARNYDPGAEKIIENLLWLGLEYSEGPHKEKDSAPYFQSQRAEIYQKHLDELIAKGFAYRCFCSSAELEQKRQRQIALKKPPRYDRTCLRLTQEMVDRNIQAAMPYIWRFQIKTTGTVSFHDLGRGTLIFDLENFADFPLTRADGSFTFMFANAVDDIEMRITHTIRGEDHLTNTVGQVMMYHAFNAPVPTFWHLPIICNVEGKKLSKRDFGFSLFDLQNGGFLPQAITNYLGIIGGSFEQEIMDLGQLAQAYRFDNIHSTGQIRYDLEKLRWVNHKWVAKLSAQELYDACLPYLTAALPEINNWTAEHIKRALVTVQSDLVILPDAVPALAPLIKRPIITAEQFAQQCPKVHLATLQDMVKKCADQHDPELFMNCLKAEAKRTGIPGSAMWPALRYLLIGATQGAHINDVVSLIGVDEALKRLTII